MRVLRFLSVAVLLFLIFMPGERVEAIQPVPLPEFEVTALDGQLVKSSTFALQGKWLLVYVRSNCQPCESLLHLLKKDQFPNLSQQVVLLVGGTPAEAKALSARFPELAQATWYADPSKNAYTQLKLKGAPVVLGVRQDTIQWCVNGTLSDSNKLRPILTSWLE